MTKRILIPIVTFAFVSAIGCKKEETASPDDAVADADDADEADADDEEADEADADEAEEAPAILNKASFDDAIHEHFDDVNQCYLTALADNGELQGTFTAEFTFDAEGGVTSVTAVEGSSLADEGLTNCVAEAAKGWSFDRPNEAGMTMRYDYQLSPAE